MSMRQLPAGSAIILGLLVDPILPSSAIDYLPSPSGPHYAPLGGLHTKNVNGGSRALSPRPNLVSRDG